MDEKYWALLFGFLAGRGVRFDKGLKEKEITKIEKENSFTFPPDLREFYLHRLPISDGFIHWRKINRTELQKRLQWPLDGIIFDIKNNAFWLDNWGPKPEDEALAINIAKEHVANAPKLIPIYSHRYIPDKPNLPGNPIYSVYQTDIVYYGYDLPDYFHREFGAPVIGAGTIEPREIEFWCNFVS